MAKQKFERTKPHVRNILSREGVLLKKHLLGGVKTTAPGT